jgi:hypothetical protein
MQKYGKEVTLVLPRIFEQEYRTSWEILSKLYNLFFSVIRNNSDNKAKMRNGSISAFFKFIILVTYLCTFKLI